MVSSYFDIMSSVGVNGDVSPGGSGLKEPFEDGRIFEVSQLTQGPDPDLSLGSALGLNTKLP